MYVWACEWSMWICLCVFVLVCGAATHSMLGRETMLVGHPNSTVTRTITHTRSCAMEICYLSALHCSYAYLLAPIVFVDLTPIVVFIAFRTAIDALSTAREGSSNNTKSYDSVSFPKRFACSLNIHTQAHTHSVGKQRVLLVCVQCSCSHLDFRFVFFHLYY